MCTQSVFHFHCKVETYGFQCVCDVLHQLVFGGTRTKFVDSCQIQMFHHDYGETSGKGLVGMVMSPFLLFHVVRVKAVLNQNAETFAQRFFWEAQLWRT